jgi:hypothetical protein
MVTRSSFLKDKEVERGSLVLAIPTAWIFDSTSPGFLHGILRKPKDRFTFQTAVLLSAPRAKASSGRVLV